jgi:2-iminobutanoate/2-iminopropanoate deaminase
MPDRVITSVDTPPAAGPYSPAIRAGEFCFFSGQIGLTPDGAVAGETAAAQARQALQNLSSLLAAAGLTTAHVVKTTIFLADMNDFAAVNEVYAEFFATPYPARSTVQVAALPLGLRVEIEGVAWAGL